MAHPEVTGFSTKRTYGTKSDPLDIVVGDENLVVETRLKTISYILRLIFLIFTTDSSICTVNRLYVHVCPCTGVLLKRTPTPGNGRRFEGIETEKPIRNGRVCRCAERRGDGRDTHWPVYECARKTSHLDLCVVLPLNGLGRLRYD